MEAGPTVPNYFKAIVSTAEFNRNAAMQFIGVRSLVMTAATMADLLDDFYLVLGERFVDARLYLSGRRAGVRTAQALVAAFKVAPGDKKGTERLFSDLFAALGWGGLNFQLDYANRSGAVIAANSFLAQGALSRPSAALDPSSLPRCAMLGGYVAGMVTNLFANDVDVKETECLAQGHPACRFEVTPERLYVLKS
ncbi:MAG: 4-vinyl reductase [Chloroflexi bacterium]|nr:4-vinyl reductase [Chloroflexota bacterium]